MEKYIQFKISLSSKYWEDSLSTDGFTLKPGESQKLYLHFFPRDLATYEFYLPVKINDFIGPPVFDPNCLWKPLMNLTVDDQ